MPHRASIDMGSNSLLLTVVDERDRVVHDECRIVGMARGLGDSGAFSEDRMAAADQVFADFAATVRRWGVDPGEVRAVATSGARRATNAAAFLARVRAAHGLRIEVVSGEEEARLTWVGALWELQVPSPLLVVDLGGGSTELVQGDAEALRQRVSLEFGSVRLTERFLADGAEIPDRFDPGRVRELRAFLREQLGAIRIDPRPATAVAVAGTATTLCALSLGLAAWDSERVHGSELLRSDLEGHVERFLAADRASRRALAALSPERADWLLAGAAILAAVLDVAGQDRYRISDRGLRFGLLA